MIPTTAIQPRQDCREDGGFVIRARSLLLAYGERQVVRQVDLDVPCGQFLAILGPSGSGKSSLMLALNGSLAPVSGTLEVLGKCPASLHGRSLERFRERISFIFQSFHLVGRMQVLHNVASGQLSRIPLFRALLRWYTPAQYDRVLEALRVVGLEDRVLDRCDKLSGGQKQRVAIARAIVQEPSLILADEPISALDPKSARGVMETLRRASREYGITIVCNLHHIEAATAYADRIVGLNEGRIVYDGPPAGLDAQAVAAIYRGARDDEDDLSDVPESASDRPAFAI